MENGSIKHRATVIVPVYNEEEVLPEFFERMDRVVSGSPAALTVVYIDDGSSDASLALIQKELLRRSYVRLIQLSRNFGQQAALKAGLDEFKEGALVFIDADLQDPPELIHDLLKKWMDGAEVVIAQRKSRAETGFRGFCFFLFHKIYGGISHGLIPPDSGIFGLVDEKAADALRSCPETNLYLQGLRGWVGFRREVVLYNRKERAGGEPKQSFFRLVQYAWNAIASFSVMPLRVILILGTIISLFSFLYGMCLLFIRFAQFFGVFSELETPGFTTLAVAIFFLGGIQLMSIGLVGEYLARVYDECKRRPLYLIKKKLP